MGLSARERQALRSIEGHLTVSEPSLALRLAVFSRLTAADDFPARECIRRRWLRVTIHWPPVWPVVWLVISIALIAVGMAVGHHGGGECHGLAASCGWHTGGSGPSWTYARSNGSA